MNIRETMNLIDRASKFDKSNPFFATRLQEDAAPTAAIIDQAVQVLARNIASDQSPTAMHMIRLSQDSSYDKDDDGDDFFDSPLDDEHPDVGQADIESFAADRVAEAYDNFSHLISGGKMRCWRVITVRKGWDISQQHPGMYWSWDKDAAAAHWGEFDTGTSEVIIEAIIPVTSIDWVGTLAMNGHPDYEDEREIRIFEEAPVQIVSVKEKH